MLIVFIKSKVGKYTNLPASIYINIPEELLKKALHC